jgi:hypothetical protein
VTRAELLVVATLALFAVVTGLAVAGAIVVLS